MEHEIKLYYYNNQQKQTKREVNLSQREKEDKTLKEILEDYMVLEA